jgi:tetratricopeptide (TPR) repeat protein
VAPLKNLALLYHRQSRFAAAEPLYRQALAILDKSQAPHDLEAAELMVGLAALYRAEGRNTEAEALYERVVSIQDQGQDHRELAANIFSLAELYRQDGRYEKAEPLYRRSIAMMEEDQSTQGPALARGLKTFAAMLRRMKRKTEAVALEAQARAISQGQALVSAHTR